MVQYIQGLNFPREKAEGKIRYSIWVIIKHWLNSCLWLNIFILYKLIGMQSLISRRGDGGGEGSDLFVLIRLLLFGGSRIMMQ